MIVNQSRNDLKTNARASAHMSKPMRIVLIVCGAIITAIMVAVLITDIVLQPDDADYVFDAVIAVLGVLFLFMGLFYNKILKFTAKKLMQGKESTVTFTFTDEGYHAETLLNDGTSGTTQGSYESFTKCREYADMWLLYLNRASVFIIEKDGMKEGTVEELTSLFQQKFGTTYKRCYRKK